MCVYTGLVDVYAKGGDMAASRNVFDEMPSRGVASCNALVVGYARNGMCLGALSVFRELLPQGPDVSLDQVSVSGVLSSEHLHRGGGCGLIWLSGAYLVTCAAKVGLELSTLCVSNALLDMYTRCGCSREDLALFDAVDCRDVTWNIVIRSYILGNRFKEERMQFRSMIRDEVLPDDVSFATALQASACMRS
jgi:pentatricopeptide repeat protein